MFRIYRYLAIASAVVLMLAMVAVASFFNRYAVRDLIEMAESHNIGLAKTLSHAVWSRYGAYLSSVSELDPDALRTRPETRAIHETLRALTEELPVLKVKIYNTDGLTIYSTESAQIGEHVSGNTAFAAAAHDGEARSKLSFKDRISAFSGEVFKRDVVETYVPVTTHYGANAGVFEIYTDVTALKDRIDHTTITTFLGLAVIFAAMYAVLVLGVVRRAIAPIRRASASAAAIGPRSSGERLPTGGMPRELLPLIEAMNGALDRLDRALDAQRRFSADAAHELLTPLAVLRANLDTLEDKEAAASIGEDVATMSDIVAQLLELAELETMGPDNSEAVALQDACAEAISLMAPVAYGEGKSLALGGAERPVRVRCTRNALTRALRNLIGNAVAHTPPGTTVECNVGADGTVQVADRGPGVPPEQRELIFRRFWRGKNRSRPGAGLGLSIVRRFADASGGQVDVADAPGGGAVFTLRLPLAEDG
ncbi:MAG: sensor histidine kinase [Kiloniellaceae bacterium]